MQHCASPLIIFAIPAKSGHHEGSFMMSRSEGQCFWSSDLANIVGAGSDLGL